MTGANLTTVIAAQQLAAHLADDDWAVVDCRFELAEPSAGENLYAAEHIAGAVYAHLDRDLSSRPTGHNGRHPLPDPDDFARAMSRLGIDSEVQVVAYDASGGIFAARLWWLLRYHGHAKVAVLDGGMAAWKAQGLPVAAGTESRPPRSFQVRLDPTMRVALAEMERLQAASELGSVILDARDERRYRGEVEPIDPVAGHIPGARNAFWKGNLDEDGRFLPPARLAERFRQLAGGAEPAGIISYCGSGVTACHNLLAMEHAGLTGARLYAGSWSEWCSSPDRPVATGDELER